MNESEVAKIRERLSAYESAKADVTRWQKILDMLNRFAKKDCPHDFRSVVFDMQDNCVYFVPEGQAESLDRCCRKVCSIHGDSEHETIITDFIGWATAFVQSKIAEAKRRMEAA